MINISDIYFFKGRFYCIRAFLNEDVIIVSGGIYFKDTQTTTRRSFVNKVDLERYGSFVGSRKDGYPENILDFFPNIIGHDGLGLRVFNNITTEDYYVDEYSMRRNGLESQDLPDFFEKEYEIRIGLESLLENKNGYFTKFKRNYALNGLIDED